MRIESSVTSLSWIPSEAVKGMMKLPFSTGIAHWDDPPPDVLQDLEALRLGDRFRFANELRAYIEVTDGRITRYGHAGLGHIGATTLRLGRKEMTVLAVPFPDIQQPPEVGETSVRFVQTAGGRTGVPTPRPVKRPPFFQLSAPVAWTTLALTLHADGRAEPELVGASVFPRHWIYDHQGTLFAKSGLIDSKNWFNNAFGKRTPWGEEDAPAIVTAVETQLERELSASIMRSGKKPKKLKVKEGKTLVEQGQVGRELYLLLDGVLSVEVDGEPVTELGPGAILGERAILEGGKRTSTLRAVTNCVVAIASADDIDRSALEELAKGHRREKPSESR